MVQWGDTVYGIARRFGLPMDAIIQANGLVNPNQIRAGQVLIIPAMPPPAPGPLMYVVQPGDNLYRISLKFGVPIEAIIAVNQNCQPVVHPRRSSPVDPERRPARPASYPHVYCAAGRHGVVYCRDVPRDAVVHHQDAITWSIPT